MAINQLDIHLALNGEAYSSNFRNDFVPGRLLETSDTAMGTTPPTAADWPTCAGSMHWRVNEKKRTE